MKIAYNILFSVSIFVIQAIIALLLYRTAFVNIFHMPDMTYLHMCAVLMLANIFIEGSCFRTYNINIIEEENEDEGE